MFVKRHCKQVTGSHNFFKRPVDNEVTNLYWHLDNIIIYNRNVQEDEFEI